VQDEKRDLVHVYTVRLLEIEPTIWRRIEVPERYSFWDLHVAIQDAMGWLDYHLHEFQMYDPGRKEEARIGLPDDEDDPELPVMAGWRTAIKRFFKRPGDRAR
jgi:hypothetical protein